MHVQVCVHDTVVGHQYLPCWARHGVPLPPTAAHCQAPRRSRARLNDHRHTHPSKRLGHARRQRRRRRPRRTASASRRNHCGNAVAAVVAVAITAAASRRPSLRLRLPRAPRRRVVSVAHGPHRRHAPRARGVVPLLALARVQVQVGPHAADGEAHARAHRQRGAAVGAAVVAVVQRHGANRLARAVDGLAAAGPRDRVRARLKNGAVAEEVPQHAPVLLERGVQDGELVRPPEPAARRRRVDDGQRRQHARPVARVRQRHERHRVVPRVAPEGLDGGGRVHDERLGARRHLAAHRLRDARIGKGHQVAQQADGAVAVARAPPTERVHVGLDAPGGVDHLELTLGVQRRLRDVPQPPVHVDVAAAAAGAARLGALAVDAQRPRRPPTLAEVPPQVPCQRSARQ
mmetsp:Transcript_2754/g.9678  ORF Transcript_2754/g.9678 Transcript_2754/m.9678 type:complete len:403 (+) Transcript_2754:243-1451(+)